MRLLAATCVLFLLLPAASRPAHAAPTELKYAGTLVRKQRQGDDAPVKEFSLYVLVSDPQADGGRELFWMVDEGGTGWHWPESFGWVSAGTQPTAEGQRRPRLLHQHDNTPWPLPLPHLVFSDPAQRQAGAEWVEGRHAFEVGETEKFQDRTARRIAMSTNFGRSHSLLVDDADGTLLSVKEKVFMGRGDEFALEMVLKSARPLEAERAERLAAALTRLRALQQQLERSPDSVRPELSEKQLAALDANIGDLERLAENTAIQALSVEIHRDLKVQSQRTEDVATLAGRYLGKQMPQLKLTLLDGDPLPAEETDNRIVVLHFWKYHDDPLQEPYGQVGYIDYLHSRRRKLGVKFIGVAADPKFADPNAQRAVVRAVKKLTSFMNLSYDIVRDDGTLLRQFGDPTTKGAQLPLWVVLSPSGEIVHYKVGFYDVNPQEGLAELDHILVDQIKQQRAAK